jgi:hypothetical protein
MSETTVEDVQHLIERLSPRDQLRLFRFLSTRVAQMAAERLEEPAGAAAAQRAWSELYRVGESLASDGEPESETMTAALLRMRR